MPLFDILAKELSTNENGGKWNMSTLAKMQIGNAMKETLRKFP